jgi:hypothetical protein
VRPIFAALARYDSAGETGSAPSPPDELPLTPPTGALDMPFRTRDEAISDCTWRHYWEDRRSTPASSPLEKVLWDTSLSESRLGLANWPLLDETEDLNLGNFSFPISPFNTFADDGSQQFLLLSNTQVIANFRYSDYLERTHRRIFDRAVWAMDQGMVGTATVEFDRGLTYQKVQRIVGLLSYYGVTTIIWGNELNDPNAPWRDNLPALFDIVSAAAEARRDPGLASLDLCLPGLAYYGHGEYLQKMLRTFRDLQVKKYPKGPAGLPVQRVADHYYGPVDSFLPRVKLMRDIMAAEGAGNLKYDLTEVGNPTLDANQPRVTDDQLAEGYVPQIASLAIGSGWVDRLTYYSLLDANDDHSLMRIQDGRLVKKPAYRTLVLMAKLLARLKSASLVEEADRVRLDGTRTDGITLQIVWSKVTDQDLWTDLPQGKRVFDSQGQELKPERPNQIALKPKQHPALAGAARIIIGGRPS